MYQLTRRRGAVLGFLMLLLCGTPAASQYQLAPGTCGSGTAERWNGSAWTCESTGVPAGSIVLILSGTCPTGYTEATALSGQTLVGTVAANANVGTTGGSNSITPAGTVAAPSLTMNAYTPAGTISTSAQTKFSTSSSGTLANTTATRTFSGTAATLTGTNSAPAFTGTAFDPHPAFTRVIFCQKS